MKLRQRLPLISAILLQGCGDINTQLINTLTQYGEKTLYVTDSAKCRVHILLVETHTEGRDITKDGRGEVKREKRTTVTLNDPDTKNEAKLVHVTTQFGNYGFHSDVLTGTKTRYKRDGIKNSWSNGDIQEILSTCDLEGNVVTSYEISKDPQGPDTLVVFTK